MKEFFGIASFILTFGLVIPYAIEIIKGKVQPAKSTRILLLLLTTTTLVVQSQDFTSWVLALTVGEVLTQVVVIFLAFKYGFGGSSRVDRVTYLIFIIAVGAYIASGGDTLLGLILLCTCDFVAFLPTFIKNYKEPDSDSPIFFGVGAIGTGLAIFAASDISDINQTIFPIYLTIANLVAFFPLMKGKNAGRFQIGANSQSSSTA